MTLLLFEPVPERQGFGFDARGVHALQDSFAVGGVELVFDDGVLDAVGVLGQEIIQFRVLGAIDHQPGAQIYPAFAVFCGLVGQVLIAFQDSPGFIVICQYEIEFGAFQLGLGVGVFIQGPKDELLPHPQAQFKSSGDIVMVCQLLAPPGYLGPVFSPQPVMGDQVPDQFILALQAGIVGGDGAVEGQLFTLQDAAIDRLW